MTVDAGWVGRCNRRRSQRCILVDAVRLKHGRGSGQPALKRVELESALTPLAAAVGEQVAMDIRRKRAGPRSGETRRVTGVKRNRFGHIPDYANVARVSGAHGALPRVDGPIADVVIPTTDHGFDLAPKPA